MLFPRISRLLAPITLAIFYAGCATTSHAPVPALNVDGALPSIAASYTTSLAPALIDTHVKHDDHDDTASTSREWRFYRNDNTIEVEDLTTQTGEMWQRDGNSQFFFKLFHADRRSVEYRMDDLAILGISNEWQQHALLLSPKLFSQLTQVETGWRDGYPFRHYRGQVGADKYDIVWRVDLNLPVLIVRIHEGHVERTELQTAYPLSQSPWSRHAKNDYDVIDFADLGDRESDPFVVRVQHQLPGGFPHRH